MGFIKGIGMPWFMQRKWYQYQPRSFKMWTAFKALGGWCHPALVQPCAHKHDRNRNPRRGWQSPERLWLLLKLAWFAHVPGFSWVLTCSFPYIPYGSDIIMAEVQLVVHSWGDPYQPNGRILKQQVFLQRRAEQLEFFRCAFAKMFLFPGKKQSSKEQQGSGR